MIVLLLCGLHTASYVLLDNRQAQLPLKVHRKKFRRCSKGLNIGQQNLCDKILANESSCMENWRKFSPPWANICMHTHAVANNRFAIFNMSCMHSHYFRGLGVLNR